MMHPHSSKRQSGIELARVVSMALVLISHAGFYSVGMPKFDDFMAHPLGAPLTIIYESFFKHFCCWFWCLAFLGFWIERVCYSGIL